LLSDNGSSYVSKVLEAHNKLQSVAQRFICYYNIKGNAVTERRQQTIVLSVFIYFIE